MNRHNIIETIGSQYLTHNIENDEFSYAHVLNRNLSGHYRLDIRLYEANSKTAILIETKRRFVDNDEIQLFDYVEHEKEYNVAKGIIAILANTENDDIKVWKINSNTIELLNDTVLKTMDEYVRYFVPQKANDRNKVLENTATLSKTLESHGVPANFRSQFVGTCMLALKHGLAYEGLTTNQIISGINDILGSLLSTNLNKAEKILVLSRVLKQQNISSIDATSFIQILKYIKANIIPYINDESMEGYDLLSYFFTTFNKYVTKGDKNQAFTPNHICDFMCSVAEISKNTKVLDPTCGSGSFLVQAMKHALKRCQTDSERDTVKRKNLFGIEADKNVFGLATTNMLIHSDGNSNIINDSCFEKKAWIKDNDIDLVLMNPPYNASKTNVSKEISATFGNNTSDPSKGLSFVKYIADTVNKGKLLALLPMSCAITKKAGIIRDIKTDLLKKHTLEAVFSFPSEIFFPGASAVACCMVFTLGHPHPEEKETFFGYFKEDGFVKRKGIGRVDERSKWPTIMDKWLYLYRHRLEEAGLSVNKVVNGASEWCAESYMETDYKSFLKQDFIETMRNFTTYIVQNSSPSEYYKLETEPMSSIDMNLDFSKWGSFELSDLFDITGSTTTSLTELQDIGNGIHPYVTTQAVNNGTAGFYNLSTEDGGCLTVDSAVLGYCSYQAKDFSASDHVEKLVPKFDMSVYIAMFLVTVINKEQYRYNYGRKCSQTVMRTSHVYLPKNDNGKPDWIFMDKFIKTLPYSKCICLIEKLVH